MPRTNTPTSQYVSIDAGNTHQTDGLQRVILTSNNCLALSEQSELNVPKSIYQALLAVMMLAITTLAQLGPVARAQVPDESHEWTYYVSRGMPTPSRAWAPHDLQRAAEVLGGFAQENPLTLPRFESPQSGDTFKRIVSVVENLEVAAPPSVGSELRMRGVAELSQAYQGVLSLYIQALREGIVFDDELVELLGRGNLILTHVAWKQSDELVSTNSDPRTAARYRSSGELRVKGLVNQVAGLFTMLGADPPMNTRARKRLADHIAMGLDSLAMLMPCARHSSGTATPPRPA